MNVTDIIGTPIDEATATTPLGYLEIIYFLRQQGNGHYLVTRETPIIAPGIYDITVTVQKEGYHLSRTSTKLTISAID